MKKIKNGWTKVTKISWVWWHLSVIPVLSKPRQEEIKARLVYIVRTCVRNRCWPGRMAQWVRYFPPSLTVDLWKKLDSCKLTSDLLTCFTASTHK